MEERSWSSDNYRFGFNGQEKTDEISGSGNHTTALFWEYDTRTGRRWNLDPKPLAEESPYATNKDNPILLNDPDGDCPPGSPCAGGQVGLSFKLGTKQNRIGVTAGGFAGFGSTEASGSISLFGNASSFGRKGGSFEMQLTGGLTQGIGGQTSSNQPHDFSIGANNTGRAGSLSLYTTAYFGTGGTNQRVAGFGFTAGNLKATVEDDYLPFVASKDNKFSSPLLGDAEDRFRSAAVNIEYKLNNDFTAVGGFKLFTGDPKLYGKAESAPNGFSSAYNSVGPYSTGILYGGLRSGNYTAIGGWNSEKIRTGIQNGVHSLIGSPYVPPVQGGGVSKPFLEIGTNSGTTSY